jgi:hypothetical protein
MSSEERSAASNGIWLCQNCAKQVDNDLVRFTVESLKKWKSDAEEEAKARVGKSTWLSASKGDVFMDVSVLSEETSLGKSGADMTLRYSINREKHRISIQPNLGYLTLFRNGGPIVPLEYVMSPCPFKWDFPSLDIKVLNNQSTALFLNEVVLDVIESRPDLAPLFAIKKDTQQRHPGELHLVNEGCDLTDLNISFRLSPGKIENSLSAAPPFRHTISVPLLEDHAEVEVTNAFRSEGVDIDGLVLLSNAKWESGMLVATKADGTVEGMTEPEMQERWVRCLGPFREEVGTLSGEISFTTPDDIQRKVVKFDAPVYLSNKNRLGIRRPPSYKYDTAFDVQGADYQKRVQISQSLDPGTADRFTIQVAVGRSSFHRFRATLRDLTGRVLESLPIEMNCFVPRSRSRMVDNLLSSTPPQDRTKLDRQDGNDVSGHVVQQEPRIDPPKTCNGHHLCPICQTDKPCAFGLCGVAGEVKCDSCMYVEEYGAKTAGIIEAAICVAAKLYDATGRLAHSNLEVSAAPWNTKEEARAWMREADNALEALDTAINRVHLRLKSRMRGAT